MAFVEVCKRAGTSHEKLIPGTLWCGLSQYVGFFTSSELAEVCRCVCPRLLGVLSGECPSSVAELELLCRAQTKSAESRASRCRTAITPIVFSASSSSSSPTLSANTIHLPTV